MATKYKILLITTPFVFVLDQLTKAMINAWLPIGTRIPVVAGFFDIVHFRNTGAAFGMFSGMHDSFRGPFFFVIAAVAVVLLGLLYRSLQDDECLMPLALSLVFGGIAGNILDRIRFGSVVDFLSVHIGDRVVQREFLGRSFSMQLEWPAFNVADSAITIAMVLIVIAAFRRPHDVR
jgi:signal peptidase II